VTPADRRRPTRRSRTRALSGQARYWDGRYRSQPTIFGNEPSPFLKWVLASFRGRPLGRAWVELGGGYGRDLAELGRLGLSARGVDASAAAIAIARASGLPVVRGDALRFLSRLPERSVDVVFSNLFFNMDFGEEEHRQLFAAVRRALVPRGYHAYSVRSVSDPWYGKGKPVGPDMFDLDPDGPVMHFFSPGYARRLRGDRFRLVRSRATDEDQGRFPVRVLYFLDQKRSAGRN